MKLADRSDFATGITTHALTVDKAGNVYVGDTETRSSSLRRRRYERFH